MSKPSVNIPDLLEETRSKHYPNITPEAFLALSDFLFFIRLSRAVSQL